MAGTGNGAGGGDGSLPQTAVDAIRAVIDSVLNMGDVSSQFSGYGSSLLQALTVIAVAWVALRHVIAGKGMNELMAEFIVVILTWGIAAALIGTVPTSSTSSTSVVQEINQGFDMLAQELLDGAPGGAPTSATDHVLNVIGETSYVAATLFMPNPEPNRDTSAMEMAGKAIAFFTTGLIELLMKFVTVLFIFGAMLMYVGQFMYTQIMVKLCLLMMPIMVPFIMLESMRFVFQGWFKFTITAGVAKIVGAFMFHLMSSAINQATRIAEALSVNQMDSFGVRSLYIYMTLMLIMVLVAYMMGQTQTIANGLISGFVQGGFKLNGMTVGQKAVDAGDRVAGATVGGIASRGQGALQGAAGGYKQGLSGIVSSRLRLGGGGAPAGASNGGPRAGASGGSTGSGTTRS